MRWYWNNRGAALPIVIIVLAISSIFGFFSLSMLDSQARFNIIDDSGKKAMEYAEAGYNAYLWHLNDNVEFYSTKESDDMQGVPIEFMDGYYQLSVTRPSDTDRFITIVSTGWTKDNPGIKRTIEAKIRKKQFVHHVYVSNDDGSSIWWTSGDESHGPYHTNKNLYTREGEGIYNTTLNKTVYYPVFFDTVTYSGAHTENIRSSYRDDAYLAGNPSKVDILEFPATNSQLKAWAEKDNMVFYGRTCIYLDGEYVKIRNGNVSAAEIQTYRIADIHNKVIYVDKAEGGGTDKFDLKSGNIFISGVIKGVLTIAAANDIYITYGDPTNWYDYSAGDLSRRNPAPNQPPVSFRWSDGRYYDYPEYGGIEYESTTFTSSHKPAGEEYYIREANGKDMLGLVANRDISILHFNWPKMSVGGDEPCWDFVWRWNNSMRRYVKEDYKYDVAPKDVTIHSALFAINGGFGYERYDERNEELEYVRKGDITIWGSITQRTRRPVGIIDRTGYNKKYSHDPRMFCDYPPHILEPVNVGWEIHEWKEVSN